MGRPRGGVKKATSELQIANVLEQAGKRWGLDRTIRQILEEIHAAYGVAPQLNLPTVPVTEPVPVAPEAPPSPTPKPLGAKTVILTFCALWREMRGGEYYPSWGKDGGNAKRLIEQARPTADEVRRRMRIAFGDPWFQRYGTITHFCNHWSNYDRPLEGNAALAPQRPKLHVVGIDPATGTLKYA